MEAFAEQLGTSDLVLCWSRRAASMTLRFGRCSHELERSLSHELRGMALGQRNSVQCPSSGDDDEAALVLERRCIIADAMLPVTCHLEN